MNRIPHGIADRDAPRTARSVPRTRRDPPATAPACAWLASLFLLAAPPVVAAAGSETGPAFTSPVDVAVSRDGRSLVVAAGTDSIVLIDRQTGRRLDTLRVGAKPVSVVRYGDVGYLVATLEGGCLVAVDATDGRLAERGRLRLGYEPRCVAIDSVTNRAYVSLSAAARVAVVSIETLELRSLIEVGRRPWGIAASSDGRMIGVVCASPTQLVLVDTASCRVASRHAFQGFNPGRLAFGPGDRELYVTFTYDGGSYPSPGNIRRGWVTGSRLGRLGVDDGRLEGLTLDVPGRAVGDLFGLVVAPDGHVLVGAGGTHEVLRLSTGRLPWTQIGGSEVMDPQLAGDTDRLRRIDVTGRPQGICLSADGGTAYVADAIGDAIHEIDVATATLRKTHPVPAGRVPTAAERLSRTGEAIFYDARRSLDQWYSCHTCHHDGGGNTVTFDTRNDGSTGTYKTVLPLWDVARTGPWTWHGWQQDLRTALEKSLVDSMQGPKPTADDLRALAAFLETLAAPPSPHLAADGSLSAAALRGRALFDSGRAGCRACHAGETFSTPELHDVGQGRPGDRYRGFSVPTLRGLHQKTMYMHHGRDRSLAELLAGSHGPDVVSGLEPFSPAEVDDLVAYLESL